MLPQIPHPGVPILIHWLCQPLGRGGFLTSDAMLSWGWEPDRHVNHCLLSWLDVEFCALPATMQLIH